MPPLGPPVPPQGHHRAGGAWPKLAGKNSGTEGGCLEDSCLGGNRCPVPVSQGGQLGPHQLLPVLHTSNNQELREVTENRREAFLFQTPQGNKSPCSLECAERAVTSLLPINRSGIQAAAAGQGGERPLLLGARRKGCQR